MLLYEVITDHLPAEEGLVNVLRYQVCVQILIKALGSQGRRSRLVLWY
jgi:hypothetical protein